MLLWWSIWKLNSLLTFTCLGIGGFSPHKLLAWNFSSHVSSLPHKSWWYRGPKKTHCNGDMTPGAVGFLESFLQWWQHDLYTGGTAKQHINVSHSTQRKWILSLIPLSVLHRMLIPSWVAQWGEWMRGKLQLVKILLLQIRASIWPVKVLLAKDLYKWEVLLSPPRLWGGLKGNFSVKREMAVFWNDTKIWDTNVQAIPSSYKMLPP